MLVCTLLTLNTKTVFIPIHSTWYCTGRHKRRQPTKIIRSTCTTLATCNTCDLLQNLATESQVRSDAQWMAHPWLLRWRSQVVRKRLIVRLERTLALTHLEPALILFVQPFGRDSKTRLCPVEDWDRLERPERRLESVAVPLRLLLAHLLLLILNPLGATAEDASLEAPSDLDRRHGLLERALAVAFALEAQDHLVGSDLAPFVLGDAPHLLAAIAAEHLGERQLGRLDALDPPAIGALLELDIVLHPVQRARATHAHAQHDLAARVGPHLLCIEVSDKLGRIDEDGEGLVHRLLHLQHADGRRARERGL
mmetsp:Transcript_46453/g.121948  ORF Transcript_46453/g.121948 Transcript_46453/m.121948 type:complete len:310 (-) Transcript_46453:1491-2420(-)